MSMNSIGQVECLPPRRTLIVCLAVTLFIPGLSTICPGEEIQHGSAGEFAVHVLKVYASKDVKKLLSLSNSGAPPETVLNKFAPGTAQYQSLFGDESWRWNAVTRWNGQLGKIRYERTAMVEFSPPAESGERPVLGLENIDGRWQFDGIYRWPEDRFSSLGFDKVTIAEVQKEKLSDPTVISRAVLKAYQQKDLATVMKLSVADGPMALLYLSEAEQKLPKADILFSAEEMQGVATWDGKLGGVYLRQSAMVEFGRSDSEVFVVTMQKYGDEWKFEDIHSPSINDFEGVDQN